MSTFDRDNADSSIAISEEAVCLPLSFKEITESFRSKAVVELGETAERRQTCLFSVRSLIEENDEEKNLNSKLEDTFLLKFLRVKKFDCRRAFSLLRKYYAFRVQYPHLFEDFDLSIFIPIMEGNFMNFFPHRTPSGCAVWFVRLGLWNPNEVSLNDLLKFGFMCMEKASENPVTQICGLVSVIDCRGLAWKHVANTTPAALRCFITGIQDSFPLRQKEIHIVYNHALFGLIFAFLRPFLSSKMRNRIFFHGSDLSELHKLLPPEISPEELKGCRGPFKNNTFYDSVLKGEQNCYNREFDCKL